NLLESSVDNLERFHPEAEGLPVILGNLAIVQCRFGELQRAEELLRRALESYEGDGRESRNFAVTLSDMAQVLQLKEEFHAAAPLYEQAIGIFERLGQPNTVDLAATLADEGTLYLRLGQIEESRQAELRALELLPASSNRALRAQVLRSLGNVEARGAHPSDSLPYFEESLQIQERTLGAEHPATAALLLDYSSATLRTGNKSRARKLRQRALDLLAKIG